jgi:PAS domain S-box-containing protein
MDIKQRCFVKDYMNTPNLKFLYFAYVITDDKYNIKEYDESFFHFTKEKEDVISKKITILFNDIRYEFFDEFYEVENMHGNKYYIMQRNLKFENQEYYLFFLTDYSIYKEMNNQISYLNRQQYIYNEMFNKLEDGIYITDGEGKTLYVNDSFLNLSGLTRDALIGETVYELRYDGVLPNSCCAKVIETGEPVSTINNYYKGQKCLVSGSPIYDEKGEFIRTIAVIRDVSELDMLMKRIAKEDTLSMAFKKKMDTLDDKIKNRNVVVSNNKKMKSLYEKAERLAHVDSTVLILGETGVGKDFLASYIHSISDREKRGNIIKINCGAIPEHLIESELFGYEEGAFTGAQRGGKKGLFEEAGEGTIFLDEIGDMPYTLQVKLLNALNDKKFYRIGGNKAIGFNARIIAATNADLKNLVDEKKFRADLYYRLNVVTLKIPSLRERPEDMLPLAQSFLEYYNNKHRRNCFFSPECLESFLLYTWPGNIRELKNIVERMVLISEDVCIDAKLFREQVSQEGHEVELGKLINWNREKLTLKQQLEVHEINIIETALATTSTMREAAKILDIDISTLVRKKQKYNIT